MDAGAALTDLIRQAAAGDESALRLVFDASYPDLRKLARARLSRGRRAALLDTTELVHESYLRFASGRELTVESRRHFMCYAARVMRSVIVDCAREAQSQRRGGAAVHVTLDTAVADESGRESEFEILHVHEALEALAKCDERIAKVVELRYFGGMKEAEIADALGVTERTVRRDWEKARLLLATALQQ